MYKKLYIYIFFYSLLLNPLFAFSIEVGENQTITIGEVASLEANISNDVNSDELIWKVGDEIYAEGEIFYFYPTETGTYPIHLFYQGNEEDNLTVNVMNNTHTKTLISKFSVNNKCIQVKIVSDKVHHSPSYIYIKEEDKAEQLLYTADNSFHERYPTIHSPEVIALQDGGYAVFWLIFTQMADEKLRMSRFDSNGTMVVNNKLFPYTFNIGGSNLTIKQLSNQNYVIGNCATHADTLRLRIYDYSSEARLLYEFHPHIDHACDHGEKTKIMPISNNTFVFSAENKLWHFNNQLKEIPFN